jgi:hypothetical protein
MLSTEFSHPYEDFAFQLSKITTSPLVAINNGKLIMYAVEQSVEFKDISHILYAMEDTYPKFKKICERPKSHLRAINEVRSIDTVKRVGYESISYLASHSEDWLARTASGLKPARLFSRVEEDDFQIYENRVVKTAIDLICTYLNLKNAELKDKIGQIRVIVNSQKENIMHGFGFDKSFKQAVSELTKKSTNMDDDRSKQLEDAEFLYGLTVDLLKKYRNLTRSRLYKYLKRSKHITNPLNETNILLMDKDYSAIFKWWKKFQKEIAQKEFDNPIPEDSSELQNNYKSFCKILCEYAAHRMNFEQTSEDAFRRDSDDIQIMVKQDGENIVVEIVEIQKFELKLENLACPESKEGFENKNGILYWENKKEDKEIDNFCKSLKTKEKRNPDFTNLKQKLLNKQKDKSEAKIYKISIIPTFCDIKDNMKYSKTDSDITVVAMPKCKSDEQKHTSYAKQKGKEIAFLPLTMFDINSYRRLQELFLRLIVKIGKDKCPYCGKDMRNNECSDCKLRMIKTTCSYCKEKYTYLRYDSKEDALKQIKGIDKDDFYAMDSRFQYKDIVELHIDENLRIKPICPNCYS